MVSVFATFGYANTFGAYQAYYQFQGYPNESASNISWVGSVQLFFQFSLGAVSGVLYDKGYFYHLMTAGGVIYMVRYVLTPSSIFPADFVQLVYDISREGILADYARSRIRGRDRDWPDLLPAISVVSQYFLKRRSLAIGIVTTGGSVGVEYSYIFSSAKLT